MVAGGCGASANTDESQAMGKVRAQSSKSKQTDGAGPRSMQNRRFFRNSNQDSDSQNSDGFASRRLFERDDWTLFRSLSTLGQKAGVPLGKLPRLVIKELVDNALDACRSCRFGKLPGSGFFVEDDGAGIPGDDAQIASLFSIRRPLTSSKLVRLPTRGQLGNGLRVVAGAVLASEGSLMVRTGGRALTLSPQDDGSTKVLRCERSRKPGTRIEIVFGPGLADKDPDPLALARVGQEFAGKGTDYKGRSSPWWYDGDAFYELLQAAGGQTVRDVVAKRLDGCGRKGSEVGGQLSGRLATSLSRQEAETVLAAARQLVKPVQPSRLGRIDRQPGFAGYARVGELIELQASRGKLNATIPVVVEAWARVATAPSVMLCVNRTPVAADVTLQRDAEKRTAYAIFGCNLRYRFQVGRGRDFNFLVNVQVPFVALTTDGKEPDLEPLADQILEAMEKAARTARRLTPKAGGPTARSQKDQVFATLPKAIETASGGGQYRFSLRQLFYAVRPEFIEVFGQEPSYGTFTRIVTAYEAELGRDIPGIYRDARGTIYHPHLGDEIPLGTLEIERYSRPEWTFNKILYCEKEGFFPILRANQWPERHDCALLTSKGFASRAARDALDLLGDTEEEITFFCIHDADGPGTAILDGLQEATTARPGRKVKIINLGLEPKEGIEMQLQVEAVMRKNADKQVPVGRYVTDEWRQWLQTKRIELNAMTTPRFLVWLDQKMAEHEIGKLVPPEAVLSAQLHGDARRLSREATQARILQEQGFEQQAETDFRTLQPELQARTVELVRVVHDSLEEAPEKSWRAPVTQLAEHLVRG